MRAGLSKHTNGAKTKPHRHPNSVLLTLSDFRRRLTVADDVKEVALEAGQALWRPAKLYTGENIGTTHTHVVFVELERSDLTASCASRPRRLSVGAFQ